MMSTQRVDTSRQQQLQKVIIDSCKQATQVTLENPHTGFLAAIS